MSEVEARKTESDDLGGVSTAAPMHRDAGDGSVASIDKAVMAAREITREVYQVELQKAWIMASLLRDMPIAEMIRRIEEVDIVGWFVDPTLYQQRLYGEAGKRMDQDRKLLESLRKVQLVIEEMAE